MTHSQDEAEDDLFNLSDDGGEETLTETPNSNTDAIGAIEQLDSLMKKFDEEEEDQLTKTKTESNKKVLNQSNGDEKEPKHSFSFKPNAQSTPVRPSTSKLDTYYPIL